MKTLQAALTVALLLPLLTTLPGCGGGGDSTPARYARLVDYAVTPATMRAPVDAAEIQSLLLSYDVDFKSDTHLPTYRLTTHVIPAGQAFVSADQLNGRIHTQFCGQEAYSCGKPHTHTCSLQSGWLNLAQRHVRCDSYNLALELDPGSYQFIANVCEITASAVTNCTTRTVLIVLQ